MSAMGPIRVLIVNTSPLIHLAEAGRLDLLRPAAAETWVPAPVAVEIRAYGQTDATARALAEQEWLTEVAPPPTPAAVLAWDLGPGESSVLAVAYNTPGYGVVIDDLAARRCAEALGIPLRGTLGLVLAAKRAGRIESARRVLEHLRDLGMYLSDGVLERVLRQVGE